MVSWTWTIALQVIPIIVWLYFFYRRKYSHWTKLGVKGPKPVPPVGNLHFFKIHGQVKLEPEWVAKYGKVYGIYYGTCPTLTIADADLVKQVLVKDFPNFVNRDINRFKHEIFENNLFNTENDHWKRLRTILSPVFTSGKLRGMQMLMNQCVEKLDAYLQHASVQENKDINIKKVILGFTIDVIASSAFATETNANDDRQKKNIFVDYAMNVFDVSILRFASVFILPKKFNAWIGNSVGVSDKRLNFYFDLAETMMKRRRAEVKQGKEKRNDLLQTLIDAYIYDDELKSTDYDKLTASDSNDNETTQTAQIENNGNIATKSNTSKVKRTLTDTEIIAQCFLFFVAGFETTATTISHIMYYLALNPDIQERLVDELNTSLDGLTLESPTYFETVMTKIPYLDAVIKETLRINPPVTRLQRRVNIDNYKLGGVPLLKEQTVEIAVYAIHHSPEYYPEPERFNPDRFMPENKHLLTPYTYLPFGDGPRNCIGMRFAYQEIKLCLARILPHFIVSPTATTKIPLKLRNIGLLSCSEINIQVNKRD